MNTPITVLKRNYSIMNPNDETHILNGRCPNYALTWDVKSQAEYWEQDHDYYIGNNTQMERESTKEIRALLSFRLNNKITSKYILFCDLEGVFINHISFSTHSPGQNKYDLAWTQHGKEFWERLKKYNPIILTSSPERVFQTCSKQKKEWCERELGQHVQVITCPLRQKNRYCIYSSILIDDSIHNSSHWNAKGGKFILYDENHQQDIIEQVDHFMNSDDVFSP